MGPMIANKIMAEGCIQQNAAYAQANSNSSLPAETVRSLLEHAAARLDGLEREIGRLGEILLPVRAAIPTAQASQEPSYISDPELIGILRSLVYRINQQTATVCAIADEVRI